MKELIKWLPWGKEAFEMAKRHRKPIFLDISAVWCHWCHVADETDYSNPKIARILNERYIPVRVDTDRRPDVNERYNMGGWPTTAVLDENGRIIFGGTYIPPEQLRPLLEKIAEDYAQGKAKAMESYFERQAKLSQVPGKKTEITGEILDDVIDAVVSSFDFEFGGFGEPKFPAPAALELILLEYAKSGDRRFRNMAKIFLEGMLGIMDRYEGGFFRYSVRRDWSEPHYEKMLDTNAGLLRNYALAYNLLGEKKYRDVAEGIIRFLNSRLSDQERGGFYGSQDADGEAEYYGKPLEERAKLPTPFIDKTIYTDWNAKAVSAYLFAYEVFKDEKLRAFALRSLDFLMRVAFGAGKMCHYFDGNSHVEGLLGDQAYTVHALLDGYELTAKKDYLDRAQGLAEWMIDSLLDRNAGGFFDRVESKDDVGLMAARSKPFFENCAAADALVRLFLHTDEEKYASVAQSTLVAFADRYHAYGPMAASYALAVQRFMSPLHITIVGRKENKSTQELLEAARMVAVPKAVTFIEPDENKVMLKAKGLSYDYRPYAQVCFGRMCKGIAFEAAKLGELAKANP